MFQYSKDVTGHLSCNINRLFVLRVSTNFGKRSLFTVGQFYGTVYHPVLQRLLHCLHSVRKLLLANIVVNVFVVHVLLIL